MVALLLDNNNSGNGITSRGRVQQQRRNNIVANDGGNNNKNNQNKASAAARSLLIQVLSLVIMCGLMMMWISSSNPYFHHDDGRFVVNDSLLRSSSSSSSSSQQQQRQEQQQQQQENNNNQNDDDDDSYDNVGGTRSTLQSKYGGGWDPNHPLGIPAGSIKNLPSIQVQDVELDNQRNIYGGIGDKKHLGGFTDIDMHGISPMVWKHMITKYGIHSILDVGCGRGISTSWFLLHGLDTLCVEGSHDAVQKTMIPNPSKHVIEHDYARGPWWPAEKTYDAVWAVEFLEHVSLQYQFNYISTFRKAAMIFVTSSRWGGWHHVEVHYDDWWIRKYEMYGFKYDDKLTKEIRTIAQKEGTMMIQSGIKIKNSNYFAQHIMMSMKVFINPAVASLPQHVHLFPELGCFGGNDQKHNNQIIHRECGQGKWGIHETPLNPELFPLQLIDDMDDQWIQLVNQHIEQQQEEEDKPIKKKEKEEE